MLGEVLWHAEWESPVATATTIQNKLLIKDEAFVEYWLALALTTIHENSGNLDPISQFVQVRKELSPVAVQVVSVGKIVGCRQVIAVIPTSGDTGDGTNQRWIVNSRIDLATWNDQYNWYRENCILRAGRSNTRIDFGSVTHSIAISIQLHT